MNDKLFECKKVKDLFTEPIFSNNQYNTITEVYEQWEKGDIEWEEGLKIISEKKLIRIHEMSIIKTIAIDLGLHRKDTGKNTWLKKLLANVRETYFNYLLIIDTKKKDYSFDVFIRAVLNDKNIKSFQKEYKTLIIDKGLEIQFWDLVKLISEQLAK